LTTSRKSAGNPPEKVSGNKVKTKSRIVPAGKMAGVPEKSEKVSERKGKTAAPHGPAPWGEHAAAGQGGTTILEWHHHYRTRQRTSQASYDGQGPFGLVQAAS